MFIRFLSVLFFSLYYRCLCCIISIGHALGDFRYSFHILRIPWLEMILVSSTKKKSPTFSTFCFTWLFALLLKRE